MTDATKMRSHSKMVEGFRINQVMGLLGCVRGKNVIGGDVVCLMPTKGHPNQITSLVAHSILFEILCLIADNLRNQSGI